MSFEVKMPQLSDTMHSGKIVIWHKKEGDSVNRGDALAEVETDKANLQIEAFQPGVLLKVVTTAGNTANVGEVIAFIGQAGETVSTTSNGVKAEAPKPGASAPSPATPRSEAPTPVAAPVASAVTKLEPGDSDRIKASPLARKLAEQRNINLSTVLGSGPQGRITKKDLDSAAQVPAAAPTTAALSVAETPARAPAAPTAPQPAQGTGASTPFSKMRDTIARRMVESVTTCPHFYVTTSIRMDEAMRLREFLKEKPEYKGISVNHLVIKAVAYALRNERRVNRAVRDGQIYDPSQINIGIVTALDDGLLIPVIKDADQLSLRDVVFEARAAVERARAGRPNSTDLTGGTFSISNMGMYDVENFTAIINPGQGGILAVSSVKEEALVEDGALVVGLRMKVTISVDHRIIDGVMAGTFLKHFKEALEMPALLMN